MTASLPTALNEKGVSILADLAHHNNGSDTLIRHWMNRNHVLTEGVNELRNAADSYWLVDLIFSHQPSQAARREAFQVWTLYVRDGDKPLSYPTQTSRLSNVTQKRLDARFSAVAIMTDGNSKVPQITQRIPYTDFPINGLALWLEKDGPTCTLMLPSER